MHPVKATWDKTYSLHSYARPQEASVNAGNTLKAAWNLLKRDREGYRDLITRLVEGGRLLDLGRSSRH